MSDKAHSIVVDMIPLLEHPPSSPVVEVADVLRKALREAFPDNETIGSGFGSGAAELDITLGGFHVWIEVRPSRSQSAKMAN